MKMTKTFYALALLLAVTLAATGCKHKPIGITPIPRSQVNMPHDTDYGRTLQPPENPNTTPMPMAMPSPDTFDNMIKDPAALAAYTVHFAYDSAAIRKSEQSNLQGVAQALMSEPSAKLIIEGNCDERGTEEYNRSLGERRALAAREALAKLGIDPMRVRTISYGKDKPVDSGHDEAAWQKNRRDDFVLLHSQAQAHF